MKSILIIALFLSVYASAEDTPLTPTCPSLAGEYVSSTCPAENTAFTTMRIIQPNCTAIGYASISYTKEGVPTQSYPTTWDVIAAGKMHIQENSKTSVSVDRMYANSSLFRYTYTLDKTTHKTSITAAAINALENNNLLSTYFYNTNVSTYIHVKNCQSTKRFFQ